MEELHLTVGGAQSLATTPRKGQRFAIEASTDAAAHSPDSRPERDALSELADEEPAAAHLGFKTGAGATLQVAEPAAASFFGGLWPELTRTGKLLAAPGAQFGEEDDQVEAPCEDKEEPQEETVIPLFPLGCFPKGQPLSLLLETSASAPSADGGSKRAAKRGKHTHAPVR